jgi:hypothetical protein
MGHVGAALEGSFELQMRSKFVSRRAANPAAHISRPANAADSLLMGSGRGRHIGVGSELPAPRFTARVLPLLDALQDELDARREHARQCTAAVAAGIEFSDIITMHTFRGGR